PADMIIMQVADKNIRDVVFSQAVILQVFLDGLRRAVFGKLADSRVKKKGSLFPFNQEWIKRYFKSSFGGIVAAPDPVKFFVKPYRKSAFVKRSCGHKC